MKNNNDSSFDFVRALIFPDRCVFCDDAVEYRRAVCNNCRKTVKPITGDCCPLCGVPLKLCDCGNKSTFYAAMTAVFIYDGTVRQGIHNWKYSGTSHSTPFYAQMLAGKVRSVFGDICFDYIAYIPQTKAETEEKGFNQSEELARETGMVLDIPVGDFLVKLFETDRQHLLPLSDKKGNTFGVFDCVDTDNIRGKTILLIDDIKTSGSTINECAKMLMLYDADSVYCAVIAAAVSKKGEK